MSPAKIAVLGLYVALAVIAYLGAGGTAGSVALWLLVILAVAHVVEMAVFYRKCADAPGSTAGHLFNVFLFGVFHARDL